MFKRVLLAVLILIASHTTVSSLCGAQESKPPNVLFIAIDDLNDWTGTQAGHPQALTPNMDRLFERGTYFSNAHCSAPVCNTSRHSLMTCLLYTSPSPRDATLSRMPSSA